MKKILQPLSIVAFVLSSMAACRVDDGEDDAARVGARPRLPPLQIDASPLEWIDWTTRTLAIGDPARDAVHVFHWTTQGWERRAYLRSPDPGLRFGAHVVLSANGTTLAVSTATRNPTFEMVWLFGRSDSGTWMEQAQMEVTDSWNAHGFDLALSTDGDTLTMSHHAPAGPDLVHVYHRDETDTWIHR